MGSRILHGKPLFQNGKQPDPFRKLASAIIFKAMLDAAKGYRPEIRPPKRIREAESWLRGSECEFYLECLDIDPDFILSWLDSPRTICTGMYRINVPGEADANELDALESFAEVGFGGNS